MSVDFNPVATRQLATFLVPGLPLATQPDRTCLNFGPRSVTSTDTAAIKAEYDFSSATVLNPGA
jgi:hypothetical protein